MEASNRKKRVIFMGKKPASVSALMHLLERGFEVTAVVAPENEKDLYYEPKLSVVAKDFGIPVLTEKEIYDSARKSDKYASDIDLVISFLFWNRIKQPLISLAKIGAINFHPAPLPELRGVGGYNVAIYEKRKKYGVSAHYISEDIDGGDIIKVKNFDVNQNDLSVHSLEIESQRELLELFKEIVDDINEGKTLPRKKQGSGKYFSKKDFEELRKIRSKDKPEIIDRKIKAFWYPPYPGAGLHISGEEYTIVNDEILKREGRLLHEPPRSKKKGYVHESVYAQAVENLTLKYVDILVVLTSPGTENKYAVGVRKENPGRGFYWLVGGRSKHFMPYGERAIELIREDVGDIKKMPKPFYIGNARLFWPNSRFEAKEGGITTDGDISLFAVELPHNTKIGVGRCFTEIFILNENEARDKNGYLAFAIDCYKHYKNNGTAYPTPKEFHF